MAGGKRGRIVLTEAAPSGNVSGPPAVTGKRGEKLTPRQVFAEAYPTAEGSYGMPMLGVASAEREAERMVAKAEAKAAPGFVSRLFGAPIEGEKGLGGKALEKAGDSRAWP